ncbi:hypothetical protein [Nonomuraea terrae]|uniref:hypothetical protein n=1 Tax=Nonomuraea terrae TaxID=2530383 RepID=UPI001FE37E5D|nr:hypothetical protein [Nonomuraea terrae]
MAVLLQLIENAAVAGVVGLVVSGAMGLIAFAAAVLIRIRALSAFAVRRAMPRHFVVAAVLGLVAYVLGPIVAVVYMLVSGDTQNVQTGYQAAAAADWWSLVLALVAGAIITPLGERGSSAGFSRTHFSPATKPGSRSS